ncbi:GNAT family N-acetyltransferase [uncultured Cohaesibacter sp.]|uniref:GNAT family N-acetyltransferase n=1 Tax=uncultured Cohaesibacter sp. TaxID=1002546 RepID=UPI002AAB5FDE|nr:GNAT family N-acetyltransferase [uncultured Cohaesibacter sp.]
MINPEDQKYIIEPFDPDKHDRTAFSCGVEQVDNFFKKTANKLAKAGNLRVYVMTDNEGAVIGYYALNAHSIDYQDLPKKFARTRPSHGYIPAAFIAMIGVDQKYAGHGFGGDLLVNALTRVEQAADEIGIGVVLLDVLDDGMPESIERRLALYQRYGFQPLPSNPLRLFLLVATVRELIS